MCEENLKKKLNVGTKNDHKSSKCVKRSTFKVLWGGGTVHHFLLLSFKKTKKQKNI